MAPLELLYSVGNAVEAAQLSTDAIKLRKVLGVSPSDCWSDMHDRVLLLGTFRYGFGCYDRYAEDPEIRLADVYFYTATSLQPGGRRAAQDEDFDAEWKYLPEKRAVTVHFPKVDWSGQLREVLDRWPAVFEAAGHWRKMPSSWKPEHEHRFFKSILELGINSAIKILDTRGFPHPLPPFLHKEPSIVKCIQTLHHSIKGIHVQPVAEQVRFPRWPCRGHFLPAKFRGSRRYPEKSNST
jgi:hypothetical protein